MTADLTPAERAQLESIVRRLEAAWNAMDGPAFSAPFAGDADYVNIRGEHHRGRAAIAAGHTAIFRTIYAGSTVRFAVEAARLLRPEVALVHVHSVLEAPHGPLAGRHGARFSLVVTMEGTGWEIAALHNTVETVSPRDRSPSEARMQLGAFSISLAVKDIAASKAFYEKFGFVEFMGNVAQNWLILRNGPHVIGLFQGMFERNIITFNPGWDQHAQALASFTDVRQLQQQLKAQGVMLQQEADEKTTGPGSFIAVDPDGNPILVDQHV